MAYQITDFDVSPDPTVTGTVARTLGNITSNAAGAHGVAGSGARTLSNATLAGAGAVGASGSVARTLASGTLAASGSAGTGGAGLNRTLANVTLAGTGAVGASGTLARTLGATTSAGAGTALAIGTVTGSLNRALAGATSAGVVLSTNEGLWWPAGYLDPAFTVRRPRYGVETGGDYVRGSSVATLPRTILRHPRTTPGFSDIAGRSLLFAKPISYSAIQVMWDWPSTVAGNWQEVALVRSAFGNPSTPTDGQTIFRAMRIAFDTPTGLDPPPVIEDTPLTPGHYYYYTIFFRSGLEWVRTMTSSALLPRRFGHADKMYEALPPFYQFKDEEFRPGNGYLRQLFNVCGFELDLQREYVEQFQQLHHIDVAPIHLLRKLGENYGVPYESGIGDIRYRALLATLSQLYNLRGTTAGLLGLVETVTKYESAATRGSNIMLLTDDSDFYEGTGNWGSLAPESTTVMATTLVSELAVAAVGSAAPRLANTTCQAAGSFSTLPATLTLNKTLDNTICSSYGHVAGLTSYVTKNDPATIPPPAGYGRGTMRLNITIPTPSTKGVFFAVGDGESADGRRIIPLTSGISVNGLDVYQFSVQMKVSAICDVKLYMLWCDASGQPGGLLSFATAGNLSVADTTWHSYVTQGPAPSNAAYVIPCIRIKQQGANPWPAYVDVAGAVVTDLSSTGSVSAVSPNQFALMGVPGRTMGATDGIHTGYFIGTP